MSKPKPKPMDTERLDDLRSRLRYASDVIWSAAAAEGIDIFVFVDELFADRDHHAARADAAEAEAKRWRARVQVTDDDIRAAELVDDGGDAIDPDVCVESPQLAAWLHANGLHVVDHTNWDGGGETWRCGIWSADPASDSTSELLFAGSTMAHDHIVNMLADHVGRPPLDVLDEIAAMEVSDG